MTKKEKTKKTEATKKVTLDDNLNDDDIDELLENMEEENNKETVKCIDFTKYKLVKPTNLRKKVNIPDKYRVYFKKKKGTQMSFISLKKEFLGNIMKNKWYMDGNQKYISLPNTLMKKLKLDVDSYISFDDIDNVMYLFYL